jgi:hypothetical protein
LFVWKYIDEKSDDFVSKNMFERKIKSNRNLKSTDEILQEKTGLTDDKEEQEESRDLELENYSEFENSLKVVIKRVKEEFKSEREEREKFEENVFKIIEETTNSLNNLN